MKDKLSTGESLEHQKKNSLGTIVQQTKEAICRVFFVRHGKTDLEGKTQLPETPLNEE